MRKKQIITSARAAHDGGDGRVGCRGDSDQDSQ